MYSSLSYSSVMCLCSTHTPHPVPAVSSIDYLVSRNISLVTDGIDLSPSTFSPAPHIYHSGASASRRPAAGCAGSGAPVCTF